MMKEKLENVEIEVVLFDEKDVIATSNMTIVVGGEPAQGDPFADDGF